MSKVVTEAMRRDPDAAMTQAIVVFRHALRGEVDEVHRLMTEELHTMLGGDWQWCHLIADCYALIDSRDLALNWLEKAIDMGYTNYPSPPSIVWGSCTEHVAWSDSWKISIRLGTSVSLVPI